MAELSIVKYEEQWESKWDDFVMNHSVNGTFLQTRNFLNYHGKRFEDASILILKGQNTIVAVIPACTVQEGNKKIFSSHKGSTFGGIVVDQQFNNIEHIDAIMDCIEQHLEDNSYNEAQIKCTSEIFTRGNVNYLDYFLFQRGYTAGYELSCYIDFQTYQEDILANFTAARRRDYRYSLKNGLDFKQLESICEVEEFYRILCENLQKFDAKPVHSLEELLEFKEKRLTDIVEFYGVYDPKEMIAGSMVFNFHNQVFHTQYLAARQQCLKLYPMNYLDACMIKEARDRGFRYFSFGTSTEEHGRILNKQLAQFKEGFGTQCGLNITFVKQMAKE